MRKFIFDDMGTGKTRRSFELLAPSESSFIVICPNAKVAKSAWLKEAEHQGMVGLSVLSGIKDERIDETVNLFRNSTSTTILVTTYGMCERLRASLSRTHKRGEKLDFDLVVDESHYVKNVRSGRYRDVLRFARNSDSCLLLTGTPVPASLEDIYAQTTILYPNKEERVAHYGLGFQSLGLFRRSFGICKTIYVNGHSVDQWRYRPEMAVRVSDILSMDILERRTTTIEEPRPKWIRAIKTPEEITAIDKWMSEGELSDEVYATNASAKAVKRGQLDDGFAYHTEDEGALHIGDSKVHAAMEYAADCIRRDEPLLIWVRYAEMKNRIMTGWRRILPIDALLEDPERVLADGNRIFIANPQSSGTGVDGIQSFIREQLWIDLPWTAAEYHQANARLVRRGQMGDPVIHVVDTEWNRKVMDVIEGRAKLDDIVKNGFASSVDTPDGFDASWGEKPPESPETNDYVEPVF